MIRDIPALDADAANVRHACELGEDDVLVAAMPMSHSYGVDMMLGSMLAGAHLVIVHPFDAGLLAEILMSTATVFPGVPFMFDALENIAPHHRPAHLRLLFSAGAPMPAEARSRFEAAWNAPIGDLYGATELGTVIFNDPRSPRFLSGAVGLPLSGVSVRVLDIAEPTRTCPVNTEGQIAVAAPSMFRGYVEEDMNGAMTCADRSSSCIDGHWLTGDLGHIDAHGRVFITGRLKMLVDVGGLKVNLLEVESALLTHPAVAECVVVPIELSSTIRRLRAMFVGRDGAPPPGVDELRNHLRPLLAPHKIPREFERVTWLPRTASGKVRRDPSITEAR